MEQKTRRGGLVWPVILIGAGVVFLLNNLGILSWDIWETLFKMWPVLLIAIGLDLAIGRRTVWGGLLALALILLVLGGGVWLAQKEMVGGSKVETTDTVDYALNNATRADVTISPAVGDLRVSALPASSAKLAEGKVELVRGESLLRSAGNGTLSLSSSKGNWGPVFGWKNARAWDVSLNAGVPLTLDLKMAAGVVNADLTGMKIERLDVSLAVGQAIVRLPAEGRYAAKVSAAVGELIVEVPAGLGIRVKAGTALAGRSFPAGYTQQGEYFMSPGYNTAQSRVELDTGVAIGNLVVREVK